MEELSGNDASVVEDYDPDYEFDAARFYDFRRSETRSEAEEAERWFQHAPPYPPSPFPAKPREADMSERPTGTDHDMNTETSASTCENGDDPEIRSKSVVKLSMSSTLMKPTASYLAKQNGIQEVLCSRLLRSQRFSVEDHKTSSQSSPINENRATKRQKLEAGYLRKVANLKHQTPLQHKICRRVGHDVDSVPAGRKYTIPKEFYLETAHRALRHRSKDTEQSGDSTESNSLVFRARRLNHKIPLASLHRKRELRLARFQARDVSSITATENVMPEVNRSPCDDGSHQNYGTISQLRDSKSDKKMKSPTEKHDPPLDLFQKVRTQ